MKEKDWDYIVFWCNQDKAHRSYSSCRWRQNALIDTCSPKCKQAKSLGIGKLKRRKK